MYTGTDSDELGPKLSAKGKQYSEASERAISKLEDLDRDFAAMAKRVADLDLNIDPSSIDSLVSAKNELAQIIGELDRMQATQVMTFVHVCV
jgi:hypothetical protein